MTQHPLQELLDALTIERFTPPTPSDPPPATERIPTLHVLAERRQALIEASEPHATREAS